ncbi:adenosylcobinamide amidohydrolase [Haloprofundus marisrubri]|uniref:Adenosylcobinamide amidohydrolase n=1 Tax=Haloprofundus marisrubri TaxID=1514971 RepID=A0A0W1RC64_9EURY|nr:adenosylcobinamide amidohydrolase [Haloprofundus marisrubri]KTG10981.1 adenosylcobinamide amidohydrolase [Haloprofundus marisrubri]
MCRPGFETTVRDGVLRFSRPGTRWLSSGFDGGESRGPAAYNVTVPDGFSRTDLAAFARERRDAVGFEDEGPTLLTGVHMRHARRARLGPVDVVATAGVSNPAALPVEVDGDVVESDPKPGTVAADETPPRTGTVNLLVGTTRALDPGALANLLTVVAEAKAATLLSSVNVPGTTSDAVVVGCDPAGERTRFSGSSTDVGAAARACVRDAVLASLQSRYADEEMPTSVDDAPYGVVTDERADVSTPE